MTLCVVVGPRGVLLGMKKRGFGAGRWNGFGGKVKEKETTEAAAVRELEEEVGIKPRQMSRAGVLNFRFQDGTHDVEMHIFRVEDFEGEIAETEEMQPQWFSEDEIPFPEMWPDDIHWMPFFLDSKQFKGDFLLDRPSDGQYQSKIISHEIAEIGVL